MGAPPGRVLADRLRERAGAGGWLAFDAFMETALYASDLGYYTRPQAEVGPAADFYTAAHVHPLFARTIAGHLAEQTRAMDSRTPLRIAELGPADGRLAEALIASLRSELGDGWRGEYWLIERSAHLRSAALDRVGAATRSTAWTVRSAASLAEAGPLVGFVVANEFLDAQPVRRWILEAGHWVELGVRVDATPFRWASDPLRRPLRTSDLPSGAAEGTIVEVSVAAEAALREVADHLVSGRAIFLDYGFEEPELLAGHPRGTLAAFRAHRAVEDPLERPGETDLSAFVNWTRLRRAAEQVGWRVVRLARQRDALVDWGFAKQQTAFERALAPGSEAVLRLRLAAKNLLFGFENFHVFELAPGAGGPRSV